MMERPTPPEPEPGDELVEITPGDDQPEPELASSKGRGSKAGRTGKVKGKKIKARTFYIPDDLFELVWIRAHRKEKTLSEFVVSVLEKEVRGTRGSRDADDVAA
jgi:hypothetical protein